VPRGALEIAVIHHRTPTLLARCLEALARHAGDVPVLVVDTAFDASLPRQLDGVHDALTWREAPNHSLAAAVNVALKSTRAPLFMHMNADVVINPSTTSDLLAAMEDPGVAMAGPLPLTEAGVPQSLGLPYRLHYTRLRAAAVRRPGASVDVPWLSGCLQVVRREAVMDVGGMDASLRFYNEDIDWCLRLRRAGWRCRLVASEVLHVGGASTPADRFLPEGLRGGYVISRRYGAPPLRPLHRLAVLATAEVAGRSARGEGRRRAWREVARRFRDDDLERSRFGATLSEEHEGC
jgi:N-acetylglucosaminyl-diphospho-decaprenol L-rhamnosyltransferase